MWPRVNSWGIYNVKWCNVITEFNNQFRLWSMNWCTCTDVTLCYYLHEENGGACGSLYCCLPINRSKAINQTLPRSSLATQDYTNRHNIIVGLSINQPKLNVYIMEELKSSKWSFVPAKLNIFSILNILP